MRIKVKILFFIITTLLLILFVSTYYTHRVVEKSHEAALKEEAGKIVKEIELTMATAGEARGENLDLVKMLYYSSKIIPETSAGESRPALPPAQREARIIKSLNDTLERLMFISSHIVRVDLYTFNPDGSLKPFFTKIKGNLPALEPRADELASVRQGETVLNFEEVNSLNYGNVAAPVHYNGSVYAMAGIKVSSEAFDTLLSTKRRTTLLFAGLAIALIAGVLIFSMDYMVNRPIQSLLSAISEVKRGNLKVKVEPMAGDEIGRLTEHFNSMLETIRLNSEEKESLLKQINMHNDELQHKIKLATEELLRRNEELSYANQSIYNFQKKLGHSRRLAAVGQLAATVAHELGTPLHSISGHLQLLVEEPGLSLNKEITRRLDIMQSQLERITGSIQNILDTTRQPSANFVMVDLNKLLDDVTILLMPEIVSKGIAVKQDLRAGLPPVYGVKPRFEEVFLNLLDNAIDASPEKGTIVISSEVSGPPDNSLLPAGELSEVPWVKVVVKDNGRGIPEDYFQDIFKPFYTTKAHGHGTGLGLAISQEIVAGHRGVILVESRINEGSAFSVLLPAAEKGKLCL
ncbi:MAG: HAMP domain-containing protein [Deltaproteobacteria bacterium]|nr:HAMP domain-containing protein [Deltaproteobacteria bacterium]